MHGLKREGDVARQRMPPGKVKCGYHSGKYVPGAASVLALFGQYFSNDLRCSRNEELVFVGVDPLLKVVQRLTLRAFDLLGHDGFASVDLCDHVVYHDARPVVLELARLEILVCSFDRASAVVLACGGAN